MAHLLLDEQRVPAVLEQVGHVRVAKTVRAQFLGQAHLVTEPGESDVDVRAVHAAAPLGRPQPVMGRPIDRQHLLQVLLQHSRRPRPHRQHPPAPGRPAPGRLAPSHRDRPHITELGRLGVAAQIAALQHRHLGSAQPPSIRHLEQRRVSKRGQPPLTSRRSHPPYPLVGVVEEHLQLFSRQRPVPRPALVLGQMGDGVPLVADLTRMSPEAVFALGRPAIAAITDEVHEQPQRHVIVAHRRVRQLPLRDRRRGPLLHIRRRPSPRVCIRPPLEPAHLALTLADRHRVQIPARLLAPPPLQHRLEQLLLRAQQRCPGHHMKAGRTSQITTPSQAAHHPSASPSSVERIVQRRWGVVDTHRSALTQRPLSTSGPLPLTSQPPGRTAITKRDESCIR